MFPALRHRNFRLLWLGNLAPQLARWMQGAALGWLTLQVTNQPFYLGLVAFTRGLPSILFALGLGWLVDRIDRRKILLVNQIGACVTVLAMALLVRNDVVNVPVLLVFAFCMGTVTGVQFLAQQALISDLSGDRDMVNAVAMHAIGNHGTRIAGPSLAGVLIDTIGFAAAFVVQAVAYLWGIVCFWRMRIPPPAPIHTENALESFRTGWEYVRATPTMAAVMGIAATFSLAGLPYADLLPYFAREQLQADAVQYGQLLGLVGVGAFIASVAMGLAHNIDRKGRLLLISCLSYGVFLIALAGTSQFWTAGVVLTLTGASSALYFSMNQALMQAETSSAIRGRVLGIYQLTMGAQPLGSLLLGTIAQWFGAGPAFVLSGIICMGIAGIVAVNVPRFWRPTSDVGYTSGC